MSEVVEPIDRWLAFFSATDLAKPEGQVPFRSTVKYFQVGQTYDGAAKVKAQREVTSCYAKWKQFCTQWHRLHADLAERLDGDVTLGSHIAFSFSRIVQEYAGVIEDWEVRQSFKNWLTWGSMSLDETKVLFLIQLFQCWASDPPRPFSTPYFKTVSGHVNQSEPDGGALLQNLEDLELFHSNSLGDSYRLRIGDHSRDRGLLFCMFDFADRCTKFASLATAWAERRLNFMSQGEMFDLRQRRGFDRVDYRLIAEWRPYYQGTLVLQLQQADGIGEVTAQEIVSSLVAAGADNVIRCMQGHIDREALCRSATASSAGRCRNTTTWTS